MLSLLQVIVGLAESRGAECPKDPAKLPIGKIGSSRCEILQHEAPCP